MRTSAESGGNATSTPGMFRLVIALVATWALLGALPPSTYFAVLGLLLSIWLERNPFPYSRALLPISISLFAGGMLGLIGFVAVRNILLVGPDSRAATLAAMDSAITNLYQMAIAIEGSFYSWLAIFVIAYFAVVLLQASHAMVVAKKAKEFVTVLMLSLSVFLSFSTEYHETTRRDLDETRLEREQLIAEIERYRADLEKLRAEMQLVIHATVMNRSIFAATLAILQEIEADRNFSGSIESDVDAIFEQLDSSMPSSVNELPPAAAMAVPLISAQVYADYFEEDRKRSRELLGDFLLGQVANRSQAMLDSEIIERVYSYAGLEDLASDREILSAGDVARTYVALDRAKEKLAALNALSERERLLSEALNDGAHELLRESVAKPSLSIALPVIQELADIGIEEVAVAIADSVVSSIVDSRVEIAIAAARRKCLGFSKRFRNTLSQTFGKLRVEVGEKLASEAVLDDLLKIPSPYRLQTFGDFELPVSSSDLDGVQRVELRQDKVAEALAVRSRVIVWQGHPLKVRLPFNKILDEPAAWRALADPHPPRLGDGGVVSLQLRRRIYAATWYHVDSPSSYIAWQTVQTQVLRKAEQKARGRRLIEYKFALDELRREEEARQKRFEVIRKMRSSSGRR